MKPNSSGFEKDYKDEDSSPGLPRAVNRLPTMTYQAAMQKRENDELPPGKSVLTEQGWVPPKIQPQP